MSFAGSPELLNRVTDYCDNGVNSVVERLEIANIAYGEVKLLAPFGITDPLLPALAMHGPSLENGLPQEIEEYYAEVDRVGGLANAVTPKLVAPKHFDGVHIQDLGLLVPSSSAIFRPRLLGSEGFIIDVSASTFWPHSRWNMHERTEVSVLKESLPRTANWFTVGETALHTSDYSGITIFEEDNEILDHKHNTWMGAPLWSEGQLEEHAALLRAAYEKFVSENTPTSSVQ